MLVLTRTSNMKKTSTKEVENNEQANRSQWEEGSTECMCEEGDDRAGNGAEPSSGYSCHGMAMCSLSKQSLKL